MFSRKKPSSPTSGNTPAMRGRDSNHQAETTRNPLARRFQADSEPDTIDLADPGRFHTPGTEAEPETSTVQTSPSENPDTPPVAQPLNEVLSLDPATGKFYVHPSREGLPVLLGGQAVTAPTELRRGDRIEVGDAKFEFLTG